MAEECKHEAHYKGVPEQQTAQPSNLRSVSMRLTTEECPKQQTAQPSNLRRASMRLTAEECPE